MSVHTVTFLDGKLGRSGQVLAPFEVTAPDTDNLSKRVDSVMAQVMRVAARRLASHDIDMDMGADGGQVFVGGFRPVGEFTVDPPLNAEAQW